METKAWKWFRYDEIFEIKKGKRLTKADMIEGEIPYIGAIDSNNGISAKIANNKHLHEANTITVSYNGSIAEAFYQSKPFWATDDVNVLYPKFELNEQIAMFLITLIYREKYRFNYGRKWDKELMQQSTIKLPITENGTPDWQWMEDFVKNNLTEKLPQKAKAVWQNNFDTTPLSPQKLELHTENWRWFRYDEIFTEIKRGFYGKKPDGNNNGNIPFIGATDSNNGVTSFFDLESIENSTKNGDGQNSPIEEKITKANCITVSNNGSIGYAFYQSKDFSCSSDVYTMQLKDKELNVYIAIFLCSLIEKEQYRFNYGRKWNQSKFYESKILLPATPTGSPDWQFMEDYIKHLPYSRDAVHHVSTG